MIAPMATLVACAALVEVAPHAHQALGLETNSPWVYYADNITALLFWAAVAWTVNRALHIFVWQGWVERRSGMPAPKLLSDVMGLLVWLTALIACLQISFGVTVTGLVTASGVTIAIIGFALRNMIADVFTGIALGIEQPFRVGDWIELDDGMVGRVTEMNWRATRIVTRDELTKVLPNGYLATTPFINYHRPEPCYRDKFQIVLGYDVTSHQAERILLSAVSQISESARIPRLPEVRIDEYLEHGVKWELRFWVPDYESMSVIRDRVQRNVLRNLHYAGVQVAREKLEFLDLAHAAAERDVLSEDARFLRGLDLFMPLELEELRALTDRLNHQLCVKDQPVVRQGDESSASLFVVKEGFLDVFVTGEGEQPVKVGWLAPGMFFGEMSLLTGAPRSATVTPSVDAVLLEITNEDIAPVLKGNQAMVEKMSAILADRQLRNDETMRQASMEVIETERKSLVDRFMQSIGNFFGLGAAPGQVGDRTTGSAPPMTGAAQLRGPDK